MVSYKFLNINKRLFSEFFNRDTQTVAKQLLGKYLVRETEHGNIIGKIVELEAYLGYKDKACHSYNYRKTERTEVMYMEPGTLYIYFVYGMYYCLNVITEAKGVPCAVLIRQIFPIMGIDLMIKNRPVKIGKNYKNLCDGPAKLCMAMNITKQEFNGTNSCLSHSKLFFSQNENVNESDIIISKRIGIDYAEEDKDLLLRFSLNIKQ
jgi:DNA-3-methyladenine glycosylase